MNPDQDRRFVEPDLGPYSLQSLSASKNNNKDLPVHAVPVYPSTHAHCDDEHIVLASAAVHWVFDEHAIPTTAERSRRKYHKIISCKPTIEACIGGVPNIQYLLK